MIRHDLVIGSTGIPRSLPGVLREGGLVSIAKSVDPLFAKGMVIGALVLAAILLVTRRADWYRKTTERASGLSS